MSRLRDRSTADLVVIVLTGVVAFILVLSIVGIFLLEIYRPTTDITGLTARIATLTSSLIGAIIGFIAGRRSDENDKSGNS